MLTPQQIRNLKARVGREGKTTISRLILRPGLNSFVGTVARASISEEADSDAPVEYVASYFGSVLSSPLEYIGEDPTDLTGALIYNVGYARPAHFWLMGDNEKWNKWYEKAGSPVGSDVYFVAVSVDWRGPTTEKEYPVGNVAFPGVPRVIPSNWPDGNATEQTRLLTEARASEAGSRLYNHIQEGAAGVDEFTRGNFPIPGFGKTANSLIVVAGVGGLLWWLLQMKRAGLSTRKA